MIFTPIEYHRPLITAIAQAHDLDPSLVEAVVLQESSGVTSAIRYEPRFWTRYMALDPKFKYADPRRVSASYGLMQIMYIVAVEMGYPHQDPEYLLVPAIGLEYGCRKLKSLLTWAKGNLEQTLSAYNGGKGGNGSAPYRNAVYAAEVLERLYEIRKARQPDSRPLNV